MTEPELLPNCRVIRVLPLSMQNGTMCCILMVTLKDGRCSCHIFSRQPVRKIMAVSTITGNRRAGRLSNMANVRLNAVLTVDLQSVLGAEKTAPFFDEKELIL